MEEVRKMDGSLQALSLPSVFLRMTLSVLCGGLIGMERYTRRRAAGFRTHILICLGAAGTTLTGQYLFFTLGQTTDISRLGAQVIAGVGVICAGSIILTQHNRVKGLTTAAGLWAAAIVGLCCGAGYYSGAVFCTGLIMAAEMLLIKLEYRLRNSSRERQLLISYDTAEALNRALAYLRGAGLYIVNLEIYNSEDPGRPSCASVILRMRRQLQLNELLEGMAAIEGIRFAQEL